jgi:AraC-like DNA-binding protein
MIQERFFKHPDLPFAECRSSRESERRYKPHMHKTFCIGAIDEGEVIYRVGSRVATLRPGSLALINPETLHACNPAESGRRSYFVLYLDAEWCSRLRRSLWRCEATGPVESVLIEDASVYRRYIGVLEFVMDAGPPREKEEALVDLAKEVFRRAGRPSGKGGVSPQVDRMKQMLSGDLDDAVSARRIASDLEANPYTLLRKFKAATGLTPHAYRLNCRIEEARKLLREGWEPALAALTCGFFDQSHLHRHFKAMTAVTPREYQVNFVQ